MQKQLLFCIKNDKIYIVTLYRCYNELDKRFNVINTGKVTKTARIEEILLNSITPISKSEICYLLPDVSPTTVEYVLGKMVKEDKIVKIGSSKNVRYLKK